MDDDSHAGRVPVDNNNPLVDKSVLLVDDEPAVRRLLALTLTLHGVPVIEAPNGVEAVEIYKSHAAEIGLVVLDGVMPMMGGSETLGQLRQLNPKLPCCLLSGHPGTCEAIQLSGTELQAVFLKPLDLEQFASTVATLLAQGEGQKATKG
jgi:DNA-binding NtrC family response regulator